MIKQLDEKKAVRYLKQVKEVLDEVRIPFWLDCGTLLGAVREKRVIPWDDDIDLGVVEDFVKKKNIKKRIARALEERHFIVHFFWDVINITRDKICITLHFYHINKEKQEIFVKRVKGRNSIGRFLTQMRRLSSVLYFGRLIFKNVEGRRFVVKTNLYKFVHFAPLDFRKKIFGLLEFFLNPCQKTDVLYLRMPMEYVGELQDIRYYNGVYKIPKKSEKYLETHYGNWRKPPENPETWDWTKWGEWKKMDARFDKN